LVSLLLLLSVGAFAVVPVLLEQYSLFQQLWYSAGLLFEQLEGIFRPG
jgi:hypothetical protein